MISKAGRIYLFTCHSFLSVLQIYHDFQYVNNYTSWISEYENIIGWLLEEFVFPLEHENLDDDLFSSLDEEGEKAGDSIALMIMTGLGLVRDTDENSFSTNKENYVGYCLVVLAILDKFTTLLSTPPLQGTKYQQNFYANKVPFSKLKQAISKSIEAVKPKIDNVEYLQLSQLAEELGRKWLEHVNIVGKMK